MKTLYLNKEKRYNKGLGGCENMPKPFYLPEDVLNPIIEAQMELNMNCNFSVHYIPFITLSILRKELKEIKGNDK